ncbi:hypothetical protein NDU88_007042 [Pleurodeles waltl]|uniref:Uncharacterized protein n=1 Tax=Pleurodeles waltl TaxID=8319 RepID=A0AAV7SRF9_PLEWA|nr:hypothetical protein NDU88_007042 [Pleurodeles waltl]
MGLAGVHVPSLGPWGGEALACVAEQAQPGRRGCRRGAGTAKAVAHAPDLEQLIQERCEALQSAAAIGTSPRVPESDTDIAQPPQ